MARKLALVAFVFVLAFVVWFFWPSASGQATKTAPEAKVESAHSETKPVVDDPLDAVRETERAAASTTTAAPESAPVSDGRTLLTVHVLAEETGLPHAGVSTTVRDRGVEWQAWMPLAGTHGKLADELTTLSDGAVEFEVPPRHDLVVSALAHDGSTSRSQLEIEALNAGEHREVTVRLLTKVDREFHGRVIARETKLALGGARIAQDEKELLRTDSDGRFVLVWASWRRLRLEASANAYPGRYFFTVAEANSEATEHTIELERGATLEVTLAGIPEHRQSSVSFKLSASARGYELNDPTQRSASFGVGSDRNWYATFDAQRRAILEDLPPGARLDIRATQGRNYIHVEADPIVLQPGELRKLTWTIGAGCRITVTALEDGKPVVGVPFVLLKGDGRASYLTAYDEEQKVKREITDLAGRAVFDDIATGDWKISTATHRMRAGETDTTTIAPAPVLFTIAADEHERAIEYLVQRGLYIEGRVLEPDGKPCRNAQVSGLSEKGADTSTPTGENGQFALGPLLKGLYTLQADQGMQFLSSPSVEAVTGAKDVELRLVQGAKLSGRVVDAETGSACAGRISLSLRPSAPEEFTSFMSTSTKPDGTFELEAMEPGRYCISAVTDGGQVGIASVVDVAVAHATNDVVIRVAPGGQLNVSYDGGESWGSVRVVVGDDLIDYDGLHAGISKGFAVPTGPVRVEFFPRPDGRHQIESVTIVAGETQQVVFHD